uniref:Uncharacterized protein n=1 Tax=Arundo donax TaxID=35708 RepID=A0A0A9CGE6_ARUDO
MQIDRRSNYPLDIWIQRLYFLLSKERHLSHICNLLCSHRYSLYPGVLPHWQTGCDLNYISVNLSYLLQRFHLGGFHHWQRHASTSYY